MMKLGKILKFEAYKIIKNKLLVISFFVFFIIFLGVMVAYAFTFPLSNKGELSESKRESMASYYAQQREFYENIISYIDGKSDSLPAGIILDLNIDYGKKFEYYDFLLNTGTFETDYLYHHEQMFDLEHRGSYIMVEILDIMAFLLPIIAIIISFYVINSDSTNGSIKNLLASQIGRRYIIVGKSIFLYLLLTVIYLLAILCPMIAGLVDTAKILLYGVKGYYVQSAFVAIFFPRALAIFLSMLFWSSITELYTLVKNQKLPIVYSIMAFGVFQLIFYIINTVIGMNAFIAFRLFPMAFLRYGELYDILDIFSYFSKGWLTLIITTLFVTMLSITSSVLCARKIAKQEVRG